jgi:hypothetical protein
VVEIWRPETSAHPPSEHLRGTRLTSRHLLQRFDDSSAFLVFGAVSRAHSHWVPCDTPSVKRRPWSRVIGSPTAARLGPELQRLLRRIDPFLPSMDLAYIEGGQAILTPRTECIAPRTGSPPPRIGLRCGTVDGESLLALEVEVMPGDDDPAPERAASLLARELEDAGADSVSPMATTGPAVPGAKAGGEWTGLIVKTLAKGIPDLVSTLLGWVSRRPADRIKIKYRSGGRVIEVECTKDDVADAQKLIRTFESLPRTRSRAAD